VPLLTSLGLRVQLALLKICELKHNVGIGQPLKQLDEMLSTRALRRRQGNAGALEHKNLSGRVNRIAKGLCLYGYCTLVH
jgi:hypothetical protein